MNNRQDSLTELEGAILSEVHHRGRSTAFQVRKAFQVSPSLEWSGSAGAVYPAIARLTASGLIRSEKTDAGRKTSLLSLTAEGEMRLNNWICDPARAASVGLDPFRLRAGMWSALSAPTRRAAFDALLRHIQKEIEELRARLTDLDAVERERIELAILLQQARLDWLKLRMPDGS